MYRNNINLFEKFKIKHTLDKREKYLAAIYFQLNFDKNGAYLKLVDERQLEVEVNPQHYSGPIYQVLNAIDNIKKRNNFQINWLENHSNKIYLAENDFIFDYLLKCENFVDSKFKPIRPVEVLAEIVVLIEGENPFQTKVTLFHEGRTYYNVLFINGNYVFTNESIYKIPSLGKSFKDIYYFETSFKNIDLEKYLSLLFSNFDHVSVNYNNFVTIDGNVKQTTPALIFEKVDQDHSLYVRFSKALPGLDTDFLENYKINKVVSVNLLNKTITISDIREKELYPYFEEIDKTLVKYKKQLKTKNDYFVIDNTFIIQEALAKEFVYKELHYLVSRFTIFGTIT